MDIATFIICRHNSMLLNFFFQYLQTLKPSYDEKDREDGKTPENRDKNNDLKILPGIYLCLTSVFLYIL